MLRVDTLHLDDAHRMLRGRCSQCERPFLVYKAEGSIRDALTLAEQEHQTQFHPEEEYT